MEEASASKPAFRFLSFANVEEDAEKEAKLKEAAAKLEKAIAQEKALSELVDYKEQHPDEVGQQIDPANDTRSLYERLREQRDKKKDDLEESKKLSNLITKLDEDDVDYLNEVAKNKRQEELRKRLEIQDALEAKRILDEQKMVEQERKMKETLSGKTGPKLPVSSAAHKSSMSKLMMSSKIRVKPKSQDQASSTELKITSTANTSDTSETSGQQQSSSGTRSNSQDGLSERQRGTGAMKSDVDRPGSGQDSQRDSSGGGNQAPTVSTPNCTCQSGVMTSMGVLASLPIVKHFVDSSDDSDAWSDDDLERRLVPRTFKRRK